MNVLYLQAPRTSRAGLVKGRAQANAVAQQQALIAHWQNIVKSLNNYLNTMRANYVSDGARLELSSLPGQTFIVIEKNLQVPPFLIRKIFKQTFCFINVQLFNR